MTEVLSTSFPTKFGMYAACDKATYRKLKAIRRNYDFALNWANRWQRAQGRLPKNRIFNLRSPGGKKKFECKDSWLFSKFFTIKENAPTKDYFGKVLSHANTFKNTPLFEKFWADYRNAKTPKAKEEWVIPLSMSDREIDQLLEDIEQFNREVK